ncbi:MAG: hypothetical protein IPK39_04350 [Sulfuritalea sp.]|nr:hypothetical protein [Sulfuritalea sp.]
MSSPKVDQAAEEAIQNPSSVETTPTPSGTGQKIPVPTADVDIGRVAGQIGGGVVGAVRDAGTAVVETWRDVTGAGSGAAVEARDTSTRFVERTVAWAGGKVSGAIDAGVAAGTDATAGGSRVVDFAYDAAGNVIAVGRGVADTGSAATRDSIATAATATDRALAAVIPAIIGVARDAADATDIGERGTRVIGSVRDTTESVVTATTTAAVAVVAVTAAEIAARGRQGEQLLEQAAALGASVVLQNGVYVIVFPATMWARMPLAVAALTFTVVRNTPALLIMLAMLAREAGMGEVASSLDEAAASTEAYFTSNPGTGFVHTSIWGAIVVLDAIDSGDAPAVAHAIRTVIEAGGTAVDSTTRAAIETAVAIGARVPAAASEDSGKGDTGRTARERSGGEKSPPEAPAQIARFSGETAAQGPAEPEGKGSGGTAGEDWGGGRSPPPPSGVTSQRTGDNARQVTAATSAERSTAAAGSAGDKSAPGAPPQIARFSGETAGQRPVEPDGKGSGTVREETGGSKAPPPPSEGTSQRTGDNARQVTAATSAERRTGAAAGTGGDMSVTAVQVYDGAVTVVDTTGEMAVRRGSLAIAIGSPATKVRFDGMVTNTAPNPGSFMVSGPLFGATTGDAPAAGLYTLVRSGQISMTQAGRDILLGPGEAGYTDDNGGAPARLRDAPKCVETRCAAPR